MTEEVKTYVRIHTRRGFEDDRRWKTGHVFKGIYDNRRVLDVENSIWHEMNSLVEVPEGTEVKEYIRTFTLKLSENPEWEVPNYRSKGYKFLGFKQGSAVFDLSNDHLHSIENVKEL